MTKALLDKVRVIFKKLPVLLLIAVLSGCSTLATSQPVTLTPIPSATTTVTSTPTPIPPTPTPTKQVITDAATWKIQVKNEVVKATGVSTWEEYLQEELVRKPGFVEMMVTSGSKTDPITHAYASGFVLDSGWEEVKSEHLSNKGYKYAKVLLVAFEYTDGPTEVLAGFETDNGFVTTIGFDVVAGGFGDINKYRKLKTEDDIDDLVGKMKVFEVPSRLLKRPNINFESPLANWEGERRTPCDASCMRFWVLLNDEQRMLLTTVVFSPDHYLLNHDIDDLIRNPPARLSSYKSAKYTVAKLAYLMETKYNGPAADSWIVGIAVGDDALSMIGSHPF